MRHCFVSQQTLHVRVLEARGLRAADFRGRSDPYVKLCLTGRYGTTEKARQRHTLYSGPHTPC